jgi:tetratricopeptide (TPR) repeat protein
LGEDQDKVDYETEESTGMNREAEQEAQQEGEPEMGQEYDQEPVPIKLRIPVWVIVLFLGVVILEIISLIHFPKVLKDYKLYKLAESRISQGEASAAINDLYLVAEAHPNSIPVMVKLVKLSMDNGYYDTAGYIIDTYISGKEVSDEDYDMIDRYYTKLENYYNTLSSIDTIMTEAPNQDTLDEAYYDYVRSHIESLLYTEGQDDAYLCYTLGMIAEDTTSTMDYLQQCYEIDPECFDVRAQLGIVLRRMGRLPEARTMIEEALAKDKEDTNALRAMATLAMAENDLQGGLEAAEAAYTLYPDGLYIRETYLIALSVNQLVDLAEVIRTEMEAADIVIEQDTQQLLNGEITLQDYYIGE